jgi:hypothetical protein
LIAGRQLDQPKLLELCEGPANRLDDQTEEVADIGTGHRQFERDAEHIPILAFFRRQLSSPI